MSIPFHDLADQYDALTKQLRDLGDQWGTGSLTVPAEPPADPPADTTTTTSTKSK